MPERLALAEQVQHPAAVSQLDGPGPEDPHRVGWPLALAKDRRPGLEVLDLNPLGQVLELGRIEREEGIVLAQELGDVVHARGSLRSARRGCARCPRCARASGPRPRPVAAAEQLTSRRCCAFECVSTGSGCAMSAIRSLICPCTSVIAAHQPGRARRLRDPDVEADVGAPVLLELGRARPSSRPARRRRSSWSGSARSAARIVAPVSTATR